MRRACLASGALLLTVVSACGGDPEPASTQPTSPSVVALGEALPMQEGRDYDVVATLPASIDGAKVFYRGVSSDGEVFGSTTREDPEARQPVGPGSTLVTTRGDVVLLDPGSGEVTWVSDGDRRSQPTVVDGIDVNDEWVAWVELHDAFGEEWTVYSYSRATGRERRIGSDEDAVEGDATVIEEIAIIDDHVVMGTRALGRETKAANQVLSAPLDGSAPLTELVGSATWLGANDDAVAFAELVSGRLVSLDPTSGDQTVLVAGNDDSDKAGCRLVDRGVLMTCQESGGSQLVHITTGQDEEMSAGPWREDIGYADLESGWARFVVDPDDQPTIYAVDIDRRKVFAVARTQGGWDLVGHDMALVHPFGGAKGDITLIRLR